MQDFTTMSLDELGKTVWKENGFDKISRSHIAGEPKHYGGACVYSEYKRNMFSCTMIRMTPGTRSMLSVGLT